MLMYSGLRKVGEAVKEKNENLLTRGYVRDRTRTHVRREGARIALLIGERGGKVGRNVRESGGGVKVRGDEGRKGRRSGDKGGGGGDERENPNRKSLHAV